MLCIRMSNSVKYYGFKIANAFIYKIFVRDIVSDIIKYILYAKQNDTRHACSYLFIFLLNSITLVNRIIRVSIIYTQQPFTHKKIHLSNQYYHAKCFLFLLYYKVIGTLTTLW